MATPIGLPAINTLLQIDSGSGYQTVANVHDINGFSLVAAVVDVTSHSTGDAWRERLTTLLDAGKLTTKIFFIPADEGHKLLLKLFTDRGAGGVAGNPIPVQIVFPDTAATAWQFKGFIATFGMTAPIAGVTEASVTFEGTGKPTFA